MAVEQASGLCHRLRAAECCYRALRGNCRRDVNAVVVEGHYVAIAILIAVLPLLGGVYTGAILLVVIITLNVSSHANSAQLTIAAVAAVTHLSEALRGGEGLEVLLLHGGETLLCEAH